MSRGRNHWPERQPRPKVFKLSAAQRDSILRVFENGLQRLHVLKALNYEVAHKRGRFYFGRRWESKEEEEEDFLEPMARATPLEAKKLLLETQNLRGSFYQVATGGAQTVMNHLCGDKKGCFHGLGTLEQSLRKQKSDEYRATIKKGLKFYDAEPGKELSTQEALYHHFHVPIPVIAEPEIWYRYHRTLYIAASSRDGQRILVRSGSMSRHGESFGSTCLYAFVEGEWDAYRIRPNQSKSIETAVAWLEKRGWEEWSW